MNCPVCDSARSMPAHRNARFELRGCLDCGHVFVPDPPDAATIAGWYNERDYWAGNCGHQGIASSKPGPEWDQFVGARMGNLRRFGLIDEPGAALEIGCSEGMLLWALQRGGWSALGCDVNERAAELGRANGVEIHLGEFEAIDFGARRFDLVIAIHTLEHLAHPRAVLAKVASLLTPKGALLVEVPTGPEEYDTLDHLQFFDANSLRVALGESFRRVEIAHESFINYRGARVGLLLGVARL